MSEVVVRWTGEVGQSYTVESSPDLVSWTAMPVAAVEQAAGYYQARITGLNLGREHAFFRVRHIDTARLGR